MRQVYYGKAVAVTKRIRPLASRLVELGFRVHLIDPYVILNVARLRTYKCYFCTAAVKKYTMAVCCVTQQL